MTAVEEMSIPEVSAFIPFDVRKFLCPFLNDACCGEMCKFWYANDCIIVKAMIKIYNSEDI